MPMFQEHQMCRCVHHARDGFHSAHAPTHYPPNLELEPTHLDIDLTVAPAQETARGTVTVTVTANRAGVRELRLDAVDFELHGVEDRDGHQLVHSYDGAKLVVTWDAPFAQGEQRHVAIRYQVVAPVAGLYFSYPTDDVEDRPLWAATDHETERARHWLPCIDHPNVRTTLSFTLRAEPHLTILANGAEQSTVIEAGQKVARWKLDFRCPSYLICFALGEFTEFVDGDFNGLPVAYYASSAWEPHHLERSFGRTTEMLAWMTQRLGHDFLFPKYYQFALPGIGGAMENISLVSWEEMFMLDDDLATEWRWLVDQVNVHEMAHSYFGDSVVCRDFSHVWLKESWATYMEQCWLEDRYGADEQQYDFFRNSAAYIAEADDAYARPIVTRKFDSSWDMFDRHLYPGGATRLHTLRNELGDETFWRAVSAYTATYAGEVVETEDFRRVLEQHSGRPLAKFFDQWFYRAGYPNLDIAFSYDADKKLGTFTVTQKQVSDEPDSPPTFELELELTWTVDNVRTVKKVRIDQRVHNFSFSIPSDPDLVSVDPEGKTLHKQTFNPGDGKLRAQLVEGTVLERIRAALTLGATGKRQNVEAIARAYATQTFWGVKEQFASAIAAAGTTLAITELAQLLRDERDPMVLTHLITQAGKFRDTSIEAALLARLDGKLAPWATRAALAALGRQPGDHLGRLLEAVKLPGIHDIARMGAAEGLATTRDARAVAPLLAFVRDPALYYRARTAAIGALGGLVEFLEPAQQATVRDALEDLLRDNQQQVAIAAANALANQGSLSSAPKIRQLAARVAHQDAVGLHRVVDRISGKPSAVAALEAQLTELRGDYRKLLERLEKIEDRNV